jgi:hypothetical protein
MSTAVSTPISKQELIESKIDKGAVAKMTIGDGGLQIQNMAELMEFAKTMAIAGQAVPPHCRNQVGLCLAVCLQALEWRMSPFAVANKSYAVNDRIAYESQLIHAVIEQRAPTTGRLRHEFIGEGDKRQCRVWATDKNESEPLSYTSPVISVITPKNSPLWKSKPDLQLYYNTSRDWARVFYPDVIMGVYSDDEIERDGNRPASNPGRVTNLDSLTDRIEAQDEARVIDSEPIHSEPIQESLSQKELESLARKVRLRMLKAISISDLHEMYESAKCDGLTDDHLREAVEAAEARLKKK